MKLQAKNYDNLSNKNRQFLSQCKSKQHVGKWCASVKTRSNFPMVDYELYLEWNQKRCVCYAFDYTFLHELKRQQLIPRDVKNPFAEIEKKIHESGKPQPANNPF